MKVQTPQIILLHETVLQSVVKDIVTFLTVSILIGLGVLVGSVVLQIVGALMSAVVILSGAQKAIKKHSFLTPQQAADYLKEKFDVVAK